MIVRKYLEILCSSGERRVGEVKNRNAERVRTTKEMVSFQFFDQIITTVQYGGETIILRSDRLKKSRTYFIRGRLITPEEASHTEAWRGIIAEAERDGLKILQTQDDLFFLFGKDDTLLRPLSEEEMAEDQ